jgi:valyl-tRNA synthetase
MQKNQTPVQAKIRPLSKNYDPQSFESEWYPFWEKNRCFEAADENAPGQESFCIMIPPPNVTGVLHIGHALTNTIQDILIRWRRMKGNNTLWLPGTDHAGIATQAQVEKAIKKEGKTRHDLGREKFLERTWQWKEEHHSGITHQLRRLGSSLDWSRERFTLDEGLSKAVREVFVRLYEEGLMYRGERVINWCPRCQTALSDLEVNPTDRKGNFWHIRYPVVDEKGQPVKNPDGTEASLEIATTRPETLLGDSGVAIHPDDERYQHLHGKKVKLPLLGRVLSIVLDEYVDREFGSGGLKVTPAHDFNDAEIGQRHNLPFISVIGKDGKITREGGPYAGLSLKEARSKVVEDLEEQGFLMKVEDHSHKVGLCQRCDEVAEPILSKQWFVKIEPLAKPAIEVVENGEITFTPKNWEKTYFEWMYNIRDWCVSRQLWWGHQIPAWYCDQCEGVTVSKEEPAQCSQCQASVEHLKQDEDVLDTWFSSALWPFSTLGWPDKTKALKTFYPTSVMETGFDIIFFWVARMVMMGKHFMGEVPFHKIYLHAMVRDENGEKMSKSKGNVIDPLVLIDEQGADPLRFTLAIMAGQGRDIKLSTHRISGYRAFCNKIWNATRFFLMHFEDQDKSSVEIPREGIEAWIQTHRPEFLPANKWILSELQKLAAKSEKALDDFKLNEASQALYDFVWHEFCDWYLELSKLSLREDDDKRKETLIVFHHVIEQTLRLLHPFIPFVTEELWQALPWKQAVQNQTRETLGLPPIQTLMLQSFPKENKNWIDQDAEKSIGALKTVIESIRNFRGENNIPSNREFEVTYVTERPAVHTFLQLNGAEIQALARISGLRKVSAQDASEASAVVPLSNPAVELRIDLEGLVDVEGETHRLRKEVDKVEESLGFVQKKLSNPRFVEKAPPELVAEQKLKESELQKKKEELEKSLEKFSALTKR